MLLKIGDSTINYEDFAHHLESSQKGNQTTRDFDEIVKQQYNTFVNTKLLVYHEENLENINEEYANILAEYRDGLLLFDLMETKIWGAVGQDTIGLKAHYEANKANFVVPERVDVIIASTRNKKTAQKIKPKVKKDGDIKTTIEEFNNNAKEKVILTSEIMDLYDRRLPDAFKPKKGVSDIYEHNNSYHVIFVNDVYPETQKNFDEARGQVISEYQQVVEERWLRELEEKYGVSINQEVLQQIKSQLNN